MGEAAAAGERFGWHRHKLLTDISVKEASKIERERVCAGLGQAILWEIDHPIAACYNGAGYTREYSEENDCTQGQGTDTKRT